MGKSSTGLWNDIDDDYDYDGNDDDEEDEAEHVDDNAINEDLVPLPEDSLVQEVSSMAGHQLGTV